MSDDIKLALKYLGLKESPNEEQLLMVESAMEEIKKVSRPLFLHRFYPLHFDGERYYVDVDLNLDSHGQSTRPGEAVTQPRCTTVL